MNTRQPTSDLTVRAQGAAAMPKHPALPRHPARVMHHIQPTPPAAMILVVNPADLAARRRQDELAYARWCLRQAAIVERDRAVRRTLLRAAAVVALVLVVGCTYLGWALYHALRTPGAGTVVVILAAVALIGALAGGHRCVTVVQHWHGR